MKARLLNTAQAELKQAVIWYNMECPGLGYEFADEVDRSIERIKLNPEAWQTVSQQTRRCIMRRFPYGIVYHIHEHEIVIIAVLHLNRHPDSWIDRI